CMTDVNFVYMGKAGPKLKPGIEFCEKIGYKEKLAETPYSGIEQQPLLPFAIMHTGRGRFKDAAGKS
ncbi:MAG TPA: hypothetical protein VHN12_00435, partial [Geobacteraceae bacterium]|nr:hypothetical protein [Geobacteraceae bacterium]